MAAALADRGVPRDLFWPRDEGAGHGLVEARPGVPEPQDRIVEVQLARGGEACARRLEQARLSWLRRNCAPSNPKAGVQACDSAMRRLTGGFYSVDGKGFAYNRLVHVLWHELHHLTTTQQHVRMDAPYDPEDPWVGAMLEIARAFPPTARDPETGEQVLLLKTERWTSAGKLAVSG